MLFRSEDIRKADAEEADGRLEQSLAVAARGDVRHVIGRKKATLQELVGELRQDEHIHIPSFGAWSMHDMLAHIVAQTGPADVWITSWTITELPVRRILDLLDNGAIRSLRMLLSERVEAMNPAAHQLARFNVEVKLTKIHAKSIVVLNDSWGITVSGSANLTLNPRIEKYVICTHRTVAEAERNWIDQVMEGSHPFNAGS